MDPSASVSKSPKTKSKNKLIKEIMEETTKRLNQPKPKTKRKTSQRSPTTTNDPSKVIFPHITKTNWRNFETRLSNDTMDEITKKLNTCLTKMHNSFVIETHLKSLHFVRRALIDALMSRNWDNLVRLLILFARDFSSPVFTPFVRNMCQILKHYHPAIRGTDLEDQIDLIAKKHSLRRDTRANVNNSVI